MSCTLLCHGIYSTHCFCVSEFVPGKEYEFEYESQVLTGFPTFSKQYAGIKITADVKLKFEKSANSMMQVLFYHICVSYPRHSISWWFV